MIKKIIAIFFLVFIFFNINCNSFAKKSFKSNNLNANDQLITGFDIDVSNLPRNYNGIDIEKLYNSFIKSVGLSIEEFESSHDYNNKFKNIDLEKIYAVKFGNKNTSISNIKYDADNKCFNVSIYQKYPSQFEFGNSRSVYVLQSKYKDNGEYIGSNAFGVTVSVSEAVYNSYGIDVENKKFNAIKNNYSNNNIDFQLYVDPEKARLLKNNLAFLCVFKPVFIETTFQDKKYFDVENNVRGSGNKLLYAGDSWLKPSINDPVSVHQKFKLINATMLEIWAYDYKSGEILLKHIIRD